MIYSLEKEQLTMLRAEVESLRRRVKEQEELIQRLTPTIVNS